MKKLGIKLATSALEPQFIVVTNEDLYYFGDEYELFHYVENAEIYFNSDEEIIFVGTYYEAEVYDQGLHEVSYKTLGIK